MNLNKIATDKRILELEVGSRLYGTDTPESDIDLSGIFVAPKEFYLGLKNVAEVDMSIVSKKDNGRNDQDAIDRKFYELRKFIKLASENNPNIIEQLFVNKDNVVFANLLGWKLLQNQEIFPHKGCYNKFIGYAISQKKKMVIKSDNMIHIVEAIELFKTFDPKHYVAEELIAIKESKLPVKDTGQHIRIGDMSVQKNDTFKQVLRKLEDRKSKFGGRYDDYVSKSGYDRKFASHLIRLFHEGNELLETGKIEFPLKNRNEILAIKEGHFTVNEVLEMAEELENKMIKIYDRSDLPNKPQIDKIEKLLIDLIEESWEND